MALSMDLTPRDGLPDALVGLPPREVALQTLHLITITACAKNIFHDRLHP